MKLHITKDQGWENNMKFIRLNRRIKAKGGKGNVVLIVGDCYEFYIQHFNKKTEEITSFR